MNKYCGCWTVILFNEQILRLLNRNFIMNIIMGLVLIKNVWGPGFDKLGFEKFPTVFRYKNIEMMVYRQNKVV